MHPPLLICNSCNIRFTFPTFISDITYRHKHTHTHTERNAAAIISVEFKLLELVGNSRATLHILLEKYHINCRRGRTKVGIQKNE